GMPGIGGSVITDGVGEAVTAEIVRSRCVTYSARSEGDAAVCSLGDSNDRQTSVEWRCQVVGVGVVGEYVDSVVAAVFTHRGAVVNRIWSVVDVVNSDINRRRIGMPGIGGAIVTDGIGEAVSAEIVSVRCVADATSSEGDAA